MCNILIVCILQVVWGPKGAHKGEIRDFKRSVDGAEISFSCGGWCARCEPLYDPVRLELSTEPLYDPVRMELSTETGNQPS
jgi:hypothetical protein